MTTFGVIAAGEMGSSIGRRLVAAGGRVLTSTSGRSEATAARVRAAGMLDVADDELVEAELLLSIAPSARAVEIARRCAAAMLRTGRRPVYVDCNAISGETVREVERAVAPTGARFVDASIIGAPGRDDGAGPALYLSGESAEDLRALQRHGLRARSTGGAIGAASALKMAYAGMNKGLTALAAAMALAATRAGAAEALREELAQSQPELLARITGALPDMYAKAHRWDFEMQEIARFAEGDEATQRIYQGIAELYRRLAVDWRGERSEIDAIDRFLAQGRT